MVTTVSPWGNSLAVRIPQNIAKEIRLTEGTKLELVIQDGNLVLKPIVRRRYALDELLEEITPENLHGEIGTGPATGAEAW